MSATTVRFQVFVSTDITEFDAVEDSEILARLDEYRPVLGQENYHHGAIVFRSGASEAIYEDQLWYLLGNLCFRSIPALAATGEFQMNHYTTAGEVIMRLMEGSVRIENDQGVSITAPWTDLAPALLGCGERFMEFLKQLGGRPVYARFLEMLEEQRRPAEAVLLNS